MNKLNFSKQKIQKMRKNLVNFHDELGEFLENSGLMPKPGSLWENEFDNFPYPETPKTILSQSGMLIEGTADHCIALVKSLEEPCQTIAPFTALRGALESSALSSWILNPNLSVQDRIARSLALRYEGLIQQRKYSHAKKDLKSVAVIDSRIDSITKKAAAINIQPVRSKKGKQIGIGIEMPSITECVNQELGEGLFYRILSAMAHGHHWAISKLGFQIEIIGNQKFFKKSLLTISAANLIINATRVLARPIWYEAKLFGFDTSSLMKILEKNFDDIGLASNKKIRFWRT